jgi:hypothetical protein
MRDRCFDPAIRSTAPALRGGTAWRSTAPALRGGTAWRSTAPALRGGTAWSAGRPGRLLVMACCLWCVAFPISAEADEPPPFGVNWVRLEGADDCLTAPEIATGVETYLDRVLFGAATTAKLFVDGYVRAGAAGTWDATLELVLPDGRRLGARQLSLTGPDCSAIADGVVFVIVLMLEDLRTSRIALDPQLAALLDSLFPPADGQMLPPPLDPLARAGLPPRPQAPVRTPAHAESGSSVDVARGQLGGVRIEASGVGSLGLLPGFSLGVAVLATLETGVIWPVELGMAVFPERAVTATADDTARGRAAYSLSMISAGLCPLQLFGALALCAGTDLGFLDVRRDGFANPTVDSSHFLIMPRASSVVRLELGSHLLLRASMGVAAPLRRAVYSFRTETGKTQLFQTWPVTARADIGLGTAF